MKSLSCSAHDQTAWTPRFNNPRPMQVEDRGVEAGFFLDCGRLPRLVTRRSGIRSEGCNVSSGSSVWGLEVSSLGLRGCVFRSLSHFWD